MRRCRRPPTPRRSRAGPRRRRCAAGWRGRTAGRRRWRSRWRPRTASASARLDLAAAEGGGELGLVEPVGAGHERHHRLRRRAGTRATSRSGPPRTPMARAASSAVRVPSGNCRGARARARARRRPSATRSTLGCTGRASREDGGMRDWVVGGALIVSDDGVLLVQNRRRNGSHDWTPPGGVIDEGESLLDGPHPRGGGGDRPPRHRVGRARLRGALRGARPRAGGSGSRRTSRSPTRASSTSTTPTASWSTPASSTSTPAAGHLARRPPVGVRAAGRVAGRALAPRRGAALRLPRRRRRPRHPRGDAGLASRGHGRLRRAERLEGGDVVGEPGGHLEGEVGVARGRGRARSPRGAASRGGRR